MEERVINVRVLKGLRQRKNKGGKGSTRLAQTRRVEAELLRPLWSAS